MSDSEYQYSDYESSSEEESRKRPRIDEEVQRRMNVISQLRGVERDTEERNALRTLQGLDVCVICMEKKIDCMRPTSVVPMDMFSVDRDEGNRANQALYSGNPVQLLKYTRLRRCIQLECPHSFHWGCMYKWIKKSSEDYRQRLTNNPPHCPICRTRISEGMIARIGYVAPPIAEDDDGFQAYNPADFAGGGKRKSPKRKSPKKRKARKSRN